MQEKYKNLSGKSFFFFFFFIILLFNSESISHLINNLRILKNIHKNLFGMSLFLLLLFNKLFL